MPNVFAVGTTLLGRPTMVFTHTAQMPPPLRQHLAFLIVRMWIQVLESCLLLVMALNMCLILWDSSHRVVAAIWRTHLSLRQPVEVGLEISSWSCSSRFIDFVAASYYKNYSPVGSPQDPTLYVASADLNMKAIDRLCCMILSIRLKLAFHRSQ